MITDRKPENTETRERETSSDYLPQRDLPMPAYEFQTPNQTTGGLSTPTRSEFEGRTSVEPARLRNFSVR
jgi:hypothetical protein